MDVSRENLLTAKRHGWPRGMDLLETLAKQGDVVLARLALLSGEIVAAGADGFANAVSLLELLEASLADLRDRGKVDDRRRYETFGEEAVARLAASLRDALRELLARSADGADGRAGRSRDEATALERGLSAAALRRLAGERVLERLRLRRAQIVTSAPPEGASLASAASDWRRQWGRLASRAGLAKPASDSLASLLSSLDEEERLAGHRVWALFLRARDRAGMCEPLAIGVRARAGKRDAIRVRGPRQVDREFVRALETARHVTLRWLGDGVGVDAWLRPSFAGLEVAGSSAGLAAALALMAQHAGRRVGVESPGDVAFTGELARDGRIRPVEGIAEKLDAVLLHNTHAPESQQVRFVLLPRRNERQGDEWRRRQGRRASCPELVYVDTFEQALERVLVDPWQGHLEALARTRGGKRARGGVATAPDAGAHLLHVRSEQPGDDFDAASAAWARERARRLAAQRLAEERTARGGRSGRVPESRAIASARAHRVPLVASANELTAEFRDWLRRAAPGRERIAARDWAEGRLHLIVHGLDLARVRSRTHSMRLIETFLHAHGNTVALACSEEACAALSPWIANTMGAGIAREHPGRARRTCFNSGNAAVTGWRPLGIARESARAAQFFSTVQAGMWMPTPVMRTGRNGAEPLGPPEDLHALLRRVLDEGLAGRTLVLVGDAGTGKSTLVERCLRAANEGTLACASGAVVPWYLHAADVARAGSGRIALDERLALARSLDGLLVVVDGLNEIGESEERRGFARFLRQLVQALEANPRAALLLVGRPDVLAVNARLDRLETACAGLKPEVYRVLPPAARDLQRFFSARQAAVVERLRRSLQGGGAELTPLHAALIASVGGAFEKRPSTEDVRLADLFDEAIAQLLAEFATLERASHNSDCLTDGAEVVASARGLLDVLARRLVEKGRTQLDEDEACDALAQFFRARPAGETPRWWPTRSRAPREDFTAIVQALARTTVFHAVEGTPGVYTFAHESLRDACCAHGFRVAHGWTAPTAPASWAAAMAFQGKRPAAKPVVLLLAQGLVAAMRAESPRIRQGFRAEATQLAADLGMHGDVADLTRQAYEDPEATTLERANARMAQGRSLRLQGLVGLSNLAFLQCVAQARATRDGALMCEALERLRADQARVPRGTPGFVALDSLLEHYEAAVRIVHEDAAPGAQVIVAEHRLAEYLLHLRWHAKGRDKKLVQDGLKSRAMTILDGILERHADATDLEERRFLQYSLMARLQGQSMAEKAERVIGGARELLQLFERSDDPAAQRLVPMLGRDLCNHYYGAGRIADAERQMRDSLDRARAAQNNDEMRQLQGFLAVLLERAERYPESIEIQREHLRLSRAAGIPGGIFSALFRLAMMSLRSDDEAGFWTYGDEWMAEYPLRSEFLHTRRGRGAQAQGVVLRAYRDVLRRGHHHALAWARRLSTPRQLEWMQGVDDHNLLLGLLTAGHFFALGGDTARAREFAERAQARRGAMTYANQAEQLVWETREIARLKALQDPPRSSR